MLEFDVFKMALPLEMISIIKNVDYLIYSSLQIKLIKDSKFIHSVYIVVDT